MLKIKRFNMLFRFSDRLNWRAKPVSEGVTWLVAAATL